MNEMGAATNATDYPQTQFFQVCRGVFEGGGCRGAAHVGAYDAAVRCGVNFSEVAGTSAGSIVAVLVAAGASPDYLLKTVAYLKFSTLLSEPKGRIATPWLARCIGPLLRGSKRILGKISQKGSAYSSERIQQWLDDRLAELLPLAERPIKFKDLLLPTWIVATDLSGRRAKIWSTMYTPDENVGFAVRCSCSIPLFFEPVEAGADLYVDGGMLSNLPAFVFAEERMNVLALGGRILGFRLEGDAQQSTHLDIGWLIGRLIDTAISGATKIQRALLSNVSTVQIPTGQVSSTNFNVSSEEVEFLLN
ncbi:MAG: patatin-like phospholipase family protein, partial [Rhodanobacter sp.]